MNRFGASIRDGDDAKNHVSVVADFCVHYWKLDNSVEQFNLPFNITGNYARNYWNHVIDRQRNN